MTTFKLLIINCYLLQVIVNTRLLIRWSGVRDPADPPLITINYSNLCGPAEINIKSICIVIWYKKEP
ncbi:uncharacterized protein METZ01_LOCUS363599, partial [marine metagenome]